MFSNNTSTWTLLSHHQGLPVNNMLKWPSTKGDQCRAEHRNDLIAVHNVITIVEKQNKSVSVYSNVLKGQLFQITLGLFDEGTSRRDFCVWDRNWQQNIFKFLQIWKTLPVPTKLVIHSPIKNTSPMVHDMKYVYPILNTRISVFPPYSFVRYAQGIPPWILKRDWRETSGQRLISLDSKTKRMKYN